MPDQPLLKRYINLTSDESSALDDIDSILPVTIYERLATAIKDARDKAGALSQSPSLETIQRHGAVTIDGDRGTGKTSVLVNLGRYLEKYHQDLNTDVYVLKPIDPTLLEDGESLFMHVVIAAILSDTKVMDLQRANPYGAKDLQQALQELSTALESIEAQNQTFRGMDRLRSIVDTRTLAAKVHNFFLKTLALLGKKLLIIPIDDVDTSLSRAFENLEVIRRYLVSPRVLPIISGNLQLYHQVVWRDFHGRLTKDSRYREEEAYETALDLATEYQRKILPIPLRLQMPTVSDYLQDQSIWLKLGSQEMMSLPNFYAWLKLFLGGPVNRRDGNDLDLGIQSTRSLTQLLRHCAGLIANLPEAVRTAQTPIDAQRAWQMPAVAPEAIREFSKLYRAAKNSDNRIYSIAYNAFSNKQKNYISRSITYESIKSTRSKLIEYFKNEYNSAKTLMCLIAMNHWDNAQTPDDSGNVYSIFDTILFQPLEQDTPAFSMFKKNNTLSDWNTYFRSEEKNTPIDFPENLSKMKTVTKYETPEIGIKIPKQVAIENDIISLLSIGKSKNSSGNKILSIYSGRILEIIFSSFIGEVKEEYIIDTINRDPYNSISSLNIKMQETKDANELEKDERNDIADEKNIRLIKQLSSDITEWRKRNNINNESIPSPLKILSILNKVFLSISSNKKFEIKSNEDYIEYIYRISLIIWSSIGMTEKGALFGLDNIIDTESITNVKNFQKKRQSQFNIAPFYNIDAGNDERERRSTYGKLTRSMTYALHDHPLIEIIRNEYIISENKKPDPSTELLTISNELSESMIVNHSINWINSSTTNSELLNILKKNLGSSSTYRAKIIEMSLKNDSISEKGRELAQSTLDFLSQKNA